MPASSSCSSWRKMGIRQADAHRAKTLKGRFAPGLALSKAPCPTDPLKGPPMDQKPISRSGSRGGGWVIAQFLLMAAILVLGAFPPIWPDWVRLAGFPLILGGLGFGIWAGRTLGSALTPYPLPSAEAALVERGPYGIVRHPIYVAGLLVFLGYGLLSSVPATTAVPLLAVLWHFKAGVEERHLSERFPGYGDYGRRVRRGI